ncbi:hypothetical protein GCM10027168_30820 [Streptomyces capparidis]
MGGFVDVALSFPTVVLSPALLVVAGFWLLVLLGGVEHDALDAHAGAAASGAGAVPAAVGGSVFVALSWLAGLTGSVLVARAGTSGVTHLVLASAALLLSLLVAWRLTRWVARPLARLLPAEPGPSRRDFVGLTCVIRTGRVDGAFGQAEVTARDGSTAVVQVRASGPDRLTGGSTALLYAYDEPGEFFWVTPWDPALDPRSPAA